ncbi:MAG: macro domain-containing protein [Bacillota bacterium]
MKREFCGVTVECLSGDIAAQEDIIAVVNAANAQLRPGGGVAGALHRAAGPGLEAEGRPMAPIKPGEAVITGGHNLPNRYVIHCLGPVFGTDKPEERLLADCYRNALRLAEDSRIDSVAFPSISTGAFGYPMEDAAEVAFRTIEEVIPELHTLKLIRFVLYDDRALEIHKRIMAKIFSD